MVAAASSDRCTPRSAPVSTTKDVTTIPLSSPKLSLAAAATSTEFDQLITDSHDKAFSEVGLYAGTPAATVLERAAELYAAGPGPGETHGYGMEALARINLAEARLRTGGIEAASAALGPVLSLPWGKRIDAIPRRLVRVRTELHAPVFRGSV